MMHSGPIPTYVQEKHWVCTIMQAVATKSPFPNKGTGLVPFQQNLDKAGKNGASIMILQLVSPSLCIASSHRVCEGSMEIDGHRSAPSLAIGGSEVETKDVVSRSVPANHPITSYDVNETLFVLS